MRVCFLLHQGKMHSGGQGVYLYNVTKEVADLGHEVHVLGGPPYPETAPNVSIDRIANFNLFEVLGTVDPVFFHSRHPTEFFKPLNFYELVTTRYGMFSGMSAFSIRAFDRLRELQPERAFDIVHDVQTLGYGVLLIRAKGMPVVANIHHPLALDRHNAVTQAKTLREKVRWIIFYPFFMQNVVMKRVDRIITGSQHSSQSIQRVFDVPASHIEVIHDGVDTDTFRPLDDVEKEPNRILFVGNSEDRNKGARFLVEALHILHRELDFHLTFVDRPREELQLRPRPRQALGTPGSCEVHRSRFDRRAGAALQLGPDPRLAVCLRGVRIARGGGAGLRHRRRFDDGGRVAGGGRARKDRLAGAAGRRAGARGWHSPSHD